MIKIKSSRGFSEWEELKKMLMNIKLPVDVDPSYIERYSNRWRTVRIPVGIIDELVVRGEDDEVHARFFRDWASGEVVMRIRGWIFPVREGVRDIVGGIPRDQFGIELYCVHIWPRGIYDIIETGQYVSGGVSGIQWYVERRENELIIANLGLSHINIEYSKKVWL